MALGVLIEILLLVLGDRIIHVRVAVPRLDIVW